MTARRTWFVTYGDDIKQVAYSTDGGTTFQVLITWRYGPYPYGLVQPGLYSTLGGYNGLTAGQSALLAGTDNYPADYTPENKRCYGNSILRSENPLSQPTGGNYTHDIVLGFSPDEDAKAYGLKAYADGEVWLAMRDDIPPHGYTGEVNGNHHKDSTVWVSRDDGKTWRKIAAGRHPASHIDPVDMPVPRGFGQVASAVQARLVGDYVFVSGTYRTGQTTSTRLFRFRRL